MSEGAGGVERLICRFLEDAGCVYVNAYGRVLVRGLVLINDMV
jgi:hypothetical protein